MKGEGECLQKEKLQELTFEWRLRGKFVQVKNGKVGQREGGVRVYKYLTEKSAVQKKEDIFYQIRKLEEE